MAVTLQARIEALCLAIAGNEKNIRTLMNGNAADNSGLQTVAKSNLIAALNEVLTIAKAAQAGNGAKINDSSTTSTTETYSVSKILATLAAAIARIDSDNDGIVNRALLADAVQWANVQNKPTTFPPAPHDASAVTSGVFDIARIPILPSQVQIVSSGDLSALTPTQQNQIGQGTVVTTTDGGRYVYSGTGSKTAPGSYVQLADITPDWSTITSKPTTRAGYGITDAQALDGTLTALAALNTGADQLIYATGADAFAMTGLTAFARAILDDGDAATVRVTIGALSVVEIGNPDTDFVAVFNTALA